MSSSSAPAVAEEKGQKPWPRAGGTRRQRNRDHDLSRRSLSQTRALIGEARYKRPVSNSLFPHLACHGSESFSSDLLCVCFERLLFLAALFGHAKFATSEPRPNSPFRSSNASFSNFSPLSSRICSHAGPLRIPNSANSSPHASARSVYFSQLSPRLFDPTPLRLLACEGSRRRAFFDGVNRQAARRLRGDPCPTLEDLGLRSEILRT